MQPQDQDRFGTAIGLCVAGFLFPALFWIIAAIDWGLTPPPPEQLAVRKAPNNSSLNSPLIACVDVILVVHLVLTLLVFHYVRRLRALVISVLFAQLLLTVYMWYTARLAVQVGGYTWGQMTG